MSGNELEADLTWILNEKVKGMATQNIPLCLMARQPVTGASQREKGTDTRACGTGRWQVFSFTFSVFSGCCDYDNSYLPDEESEAQRVY